VRCCSCCIRPNLNCTAAEKATQSFAPLKAIHSHAVGFHCYADDIRRQVWGNVTMLHARLCITCMLSEFHWPEFH